jgi:hypothetical protein
MPTFVLFSLFFHRGRSVTRNKRGEDEEQMRETKDRGRIVLNTSNLLGSD